MPTKRKRQRRTENPAARIFTRHIVTHDEEDERRIAVLWERHFQGDVSADQQLFERFAPLVFAIAWRLKRRKPDLFTGELDELLSDGSLGLLTAIRLERHGHWGFLYLAQREIRKALFKEMQKRRWGGVRGVKYASVAAEVRGLLTSELGRVPTPEEMSEALHGKVANPQIYTHGQRQMYALSQVGQEDRTAPEAGIADPPDRRPIDAEAIRLAEHGLSKDEKAMLKQLLDGAHPGEICKRFGLSYHEYAKRLNGLLWTCCHGRSESRVDRPV